MNKTETENLIRKSLQEGADKTTELTLEMKIKCVELAANPVIILCAALKLIKDTLPDVPDKELRKGIKNIIRIQMTEF